MMSAAIPAVASNSVRVTIFPLMVRPPLYRTWLSNRHADSINRPTVRPKHRSDTRSDERMGVASSVPAEHLHLDELVDRRHRGFAADCAANELGRDVERLELDELACGQAPVP